MTASAPTPDGLLGRLEALREKATPGPWRLDSNGCCVLGHAAPITHAHFVTNRSTHATDAACIVAEHNAIEALIAAIRAVETLADELAAKCPPDDWGSGGVDDAIQADTGRAFLRILAAALTEGGQAK